ncbi:type IV secretory system conjugative DNA transfer family protein [Sinorhizobium saheli]|uniref:type IV secretory system conjugative DNA transfer family protein n=1 Tax=Sinorhizobium saheli TaxID=36856 RepID=UPI001295126F|nr:type IV secretory system conjugative DNA transfer family protein [Sinorhizobium saheli]MQW85966.1 TraM recognition domain-containing protein [Sinorhizobium saheli]
MSGFKFDPLGDLTKDIASGIKWGSYGLKLGRYFRAKRIGRQAAELYGPEVGDMVEAAIRAGRDPTPILERAKHDLEARQERDRLLASPPPLYGSARWATSDELRAVPNGKLYLAGRDAFDNPSSILLGACADDGEGAEPQFVHWDDDGHLLTIAPTRSGKAVTSIVPNLLRYRGSCVVLDPKGEHFEKTSQWRKSIGHEIYRIAPFDRQDSRWVRHRYNPLTQVRTEADARSLAEQMFPRDPKSPAFFTDDASGFLTAVIMYVLHNAPPHRRTLATVCQIASLKGKELLSFAEKMTSFPLSEAAGKAILSKTRDRGLQALESTLESKLALWRDSDIQRSIAGSDFSFEDLKDRPITVYIDIPFGKMEPFAPWLRILLKGALDAMETNRRKPDIPVLFILDEFLNIGPFPEFRAAIRTHASAGVRLWFFLQDVMSLQEHYPGNSWQPFLNCSVKQFFGIDDPLTGELVGQYLGHETLAYLSKTSGHNGSSNLGHWHDDTSVTTGISGGESVQFLGRPLMTPDEIMALLSGWQRNGWRWGINYTRGVRPFQTRLVSYSESNTCMQRIGAMTPEAG